MKQSTPVQLPVYVCLDFLFLKKVSILYFFQYIRCQKYSTNKSNAATFMTVKGVLLGGLKCEQTINWVKFKFS